MTPSPLRLTGTRIRDRRLDRSISQCNLAAQVGISASYLNLIEHNRRRIGGKILNDIARALGLDPSGLSGGLDRDLIEGLGTAAAAHPETGAEIAQAEDLAARFPGWTATIAAQARRIAVLQDRIAALSDRLAHDPHLDTALHEVISAVTAIRSAASILVGSDDLDRDWQRRFHKTIHTESLRLATRSQALVAYLEAPEGGGAALSPTEAAQRALDAMGHHVPALECGTATPEAVAEATAGATAGMTDPAARALVLAWVERYRADAQALPLTRLEAAGAAVGWNPATLAGTTGAALGLVLRRMAVLPDAPGRPPMGYAACDAAGALIWLRRQPGFDLPRSGPGCPLWPLYRALGRPGQPIRAVVALPGPQAPRLTCYALAGPRFAAAFDPDPVIEAQMLVVAEAATEVPQPVGRTCRICPRAACAARREPSLLPTEATALAL